MYNINIDGGLYWLNFIIDLLLLYFWSECGSKIMWNIKSIIV